MLLAHHWAFPRELKLTLFVRILFQTQSSQNHNYPSTFLQDSTHLNCFSRSINNQLPCPSPFKHGLSGRDLQHDRFSAKNNNMSHRIAYATRRISYIHCMRLTVKCRISWLYCDIFSSWKIA
jgi:hypothetical protein